MTSPRPAPPAALGLALGLALALAALALAALASCAPLLPLAAAEGAGDPAVVRYFHRVRTGPDDLMLVQDDGLGVLNGPRPDRGVRAVEIGPDGRALTGDTLVVWVQHCPPVGCVFHPLSDRADVLVSCHPEGLADGARGRHAMPAWSGELVLVQRRGWDFAVVRPDRRDLGRAFQRAAGRSLHPGHRR